MALSRICLKEVRKLTLKNFNLGRPSHRPEIKKKNFNNIQPKNVS